MLTTRMLRSMCMMIMAFILLFAYVPLSGGHVSAAEWEDGFQYEIIGQGTVDEGAKIIGYSKKTEVANPDDITIPDRLGNRPVVSIGNRVFAIKELKSVKIPNTVWEIGTEAFTHNKLKSLVLPESLRVLGNGAFNSNELESVTIPASVVSIGAHSFFKNHLQNVTIVEGAKAKSIGDHAFAEQIATTITATIPYSVTDIGGSAFFSINTNVKIIGYPNTKAQSYAEENAYQFEGLTPILNTRVTYDGNGQTSGTPPTDENQYHIFDQLTVKPIGDLKKAGYKFLYWNVDPDRKRLNPYYPNLTKLIEGNVTLYAIWEKLIYATFMDGVNTYLVRSAAQYEQVGAPVEPVKTGYAFRGWHTDTSYTTLYDFGTAIGTMNITLYAKWVKHYSVTFIDEWKTYPLVWVDENLPITPPEPTKYGYLFKGWYIDPSYTTLYDSSSLITKDTTLYAKWEIIRLTVKYDPAGGTPIPPDLIVDYGSNILRPEIEKEGYLFSGWFADEARTQLVSQTVVKDMTVYAGWNKIKEPGDPDYYKYEYHSIYEGIVITGYNGVETDVVIPNTLDGKPVVAIGTLKYDNNDNLESGLGAFRNKNLTSVILPDTLKVIGGYAFHSNNLTSISIPDRVISILDGAFANNQLTSVKLPESLERLDTFVGAFTNNKLKVVELPKQLSVFTGGFHTNQLERVFIPKDTIIDILSPTPNRLFGSVSNEIVIVAYNPSTGKDLVELYPNRYIYEQTNYRVMYDGNGSTEGSEPVDAKEYDLNEYFTVLANVTLAKTGYTFQGWNSQPDGSGMDYPVGAAIKSRGNLTLYAQWAANEYTIKFDPVEGTAVPDQMVKYGGRAEEPTAPTKTGYSVVGWYTEDSYTTSWDFAKDTISGDMTLYAKWTIAPAVTSVSVSPTTASVVQGATQQLTATVAVAGDAAQTVTWTSSDTDSKVTVDVNGLVTVAADATPGDYTITATSTVDAGKAGTATITVNHASSGGSEGSSGGSTTPPTIPSDSKATSSDGKLTLPSGKAGEVSFGDAVKISIPSDASDKELKLTIEKVWDTQNLLTNKDVIASQVYEILKNFSENFTKPVTLTFSFDTTKVKENQTVAVFYYDEDKKTWVEVPGSKIDGDQIRVEVNHFTKFAVLVVDKSAHLPIKGESMEVKYSDITDHWAEATIKQAAQQGIVKGYTDGSFKPNAAITRAEFVTMLVNALKPANEGTTLSFTDTQAIPAWSKHAITQAVGAGFLSGYTDGNFRPFANITRMEMAMMIAKAYRAKIPETVATGFSDDSEIPEWVKGAVFTVKQLGIAMGRGGNKFVPSGTATRAEAVTMIMNLLQVKISE